MNIGAGIILAVVGAILSFGVKDSVSGVDLVTIGYILIGAGVLWALIGIVLMSRGNRVVSETTRTAPGAAPVTDRSETRYDNGL